MVDLLLPFPLDLWGYEIGDAELGRNSEHIVEYLNRSCTRFILAVSRRIKERRLGYPCPIGTKLMNFHHSKRRKHTRSAVPHNLYIRIPTSSTYFRASIRTEEPIWFENSLGTNSGVKPLYQIIRMMIHLLLYIMRGFDASFPSNPFSVKRSLYTSFSVFTHLFQTIR
jgi:hypothetical protein